MARRKTRTKRRKSGKLKPAQLNLTYELADGDSYIDFAADLSRINRRMYKQGKTYACAGVSFGFAPSPSTPDVVVGGVFTAGDTWVVHNAWTKAKAVWTKQQNRALRAVGHSAKATWSDFKVYLDDAHRAGTIVSAVAGDGAAVGAGEWLYSKLVHEADDASIDEWYLHLIGGDVSTTDKSLILGYQESRATVQPEDPDLPDQYSTNMYALLAQDIDAVADEVAQNIESTNDEPPYDHDDYPGSDTNSDFPWLQQFTTASVGLPSARLPGFQAECGLVMFRFNGLNADASSAVVPPSLVTFHLMPGNYQGVLAENMGQ